MKKTLLKTTKYLPLLLVVLLVFPFYLQSQTRYNKVSKAYGGNQILDLNQLIQIAFKRNPDIAIKQKDVMGKKALVMQSKSQYFPQLSGSFQAGYGNKPDFASDDTQGLYNGAATVSQYLYDFGYTTGNVANSKFNVLASKNDLYSKIADVVLNVSKAYYDVLTSQDLVNVQEESLATQKKHLVQAKAFHKSGIKPKIDVTKGEVQVAQNELALIQAVYNLQTSIVTLENVLGGAPTQSGYKLAMVPEPRPEIMTNVHNLVELAYTKRTEVAALKAQINAAKESVRSAKGKYFPSLSANGQYQWVNNQGPLKNGAWDVGAYASWDIFSGFLTKGQVKKAKADKAGLKETLRQTKLQINLDVTNAFISINESVETIANARLALKYATENMDLAQARYVNGLGDAIEFNDAELSLTQAKSDLVNANYNYYQSLAAMDKALGKQYFKKEEVMGKKKKRK